MTCMKTFLLPWHLTTGKICKMHSGADPDNFKRGLGGGGVLAHKKRDFSLIFDNFQFFLQIVPRNGGYNHK